jgi:predicted nuclease of predicted toxin-antitoxin system
MTFLVDADLPRSAADVVRRHGYDVVDVRDIGLRHAEDNVIASHAQREQQCLVTGDFDFADIRNYPPQHYAGIVVLIIPPTVTATYITQSSTTRRAGGLRIPP